MFAATMGAVKFLEFREKIWNASSPSECESALREYAGDIKCLAMPERKACSLEQVNKDLTRDKLIVNGREFVDHTSGTASQGLIKYLRGNMRTVVRESIPLLNVASESVSEASIAATQISSNLDAVVEWILQACTRTSHGADSYFALHSLFGPPTVVSPTTNDGADREDDGCPRPPQMPRWLITPSKDGSSQDSEVFVGTLTTKNGDVPFVLVCNLNNYCVQLRDYAVPRSSLPGGNGGRVATSPRRRPSILVRTLVAEVLDPSSFFDLARGGALKGRRALCVTCQADVRVIIAHRLRGRLQRRALRSVNVRAKRTAFRRWLRHTECVRYGAASRARIRADLEAHVLNADRVCARQRAQLTSSSKERAHLLSTLSRLQEEVAYVESEVGEVARRNSDLKSNLDAMAKRRQDMQNSISRLQEERPRSPTRKRSSVTFAKTPVRTRYHGRRAAQKTNTDANVATPAMTVVCTPYAATKILKRRTDAVRTRENVVEDVRSRITTRRHEEFERLVSSLSLSGDDAVYKFRRDATMRRRRRPRAAMDKKSQGYEMPIARRAFGMIFSRHAVRHAGRALSLEARDWISCMRATGIVPNLLTLKASNVVFGRHSTVRAKSARNHRETAVASMRRTQFVEAMVHIARVLYSERVSERQQRRRKDIACVRALVEEICSVGYKKMPSAFLAALRAAAD
eukprot:g1103.t1